MPLVLAHSHITLRASWMMMRGIILRKIVDLSVGGSCEDINQRRRESCLGKEGT